MRGVAYVVAFVLLALWGESVLRGRQVMNRRERLSTGFVVKRCVLPLVFALELISTGRLEVLLAGVALLLVSVPLLEILTPIITFVTGWHSGHEVTRLITGHADQRALVGAVVGAVIITIFIRIFLVVLTRPPRHT